MANTQKEIIFGDLDLNESIHLAWRTPENQGVGESLKMEALRFSRYQTKVNHTTYRIGLYRRYHRNEEIPKFIKEINDIGGVQTDFDIYGFERSRRRVPPPTAPGIFLHSPSWYKSQDKIFPEFMEPMESENNSMEHKIKQEMNLHNAAYLIKEEQNINFFTDEAGLKRLREILKMSVWEIKQKIEELTFDYERHYCKRMGLPLPYTLCLNLTVTLETESHTESRSLHFIYNMTLDEAVFTLNSNLFGKRKLEVDHFEFHQNLFRMRIPSTIKLRVRKLRISNNMASYYKKLAKRLLLESSYPMDLVVVDCQLNHADDYEHPIIKKAKKLSFWSIDKSHFVRALMTVESKDISVKNLDRTYRAKFVLDMIGIWMEYHPAIGEFMMFGFDGIHAQMFLDIVIQRFGGLRRLHSVRVPINAHSAIELAYTISTNMEIIINMHVAPIPRST